jgi:hypothetical protein
MEKSNYIQLNVVAAGWKGLVYRFLVQCLIFATTSIHINVFNYTKLYLLKGCGCKEMPLGSHTSKS